MSMRQSYQISLYNSSLIWPSSAYFHITHFLRKSQENITLDRVSCWCFQLILAITEIFVPHTLSGTMGHSTYFAAGVIATSLCFLFTGNFSMKEKFIFLGMLSIGLLSGRSKFYGFYALSVFMTLYFSKIKNFKLNLKNSLIIIIMLVAIIAVAWQKIYFYFFQTLTSDVDKDMIARYVLYATSPQILMDYFPFGSGFASFATYSSGEFYSKMFNTESRMCGA